MLASTAREVRLGATEPAESVIRTESWSRRRGIAAAVVAILVVALTLVLSRLDLANELNVVRSQLTAANQELDEAEAELDELQATDRAQTSALAACRDSAELGEEARAAFQTIQRGLDRSDRGAIAQGVSDVLRIDSEWAEANTTCQEAAAEGG
jgi:hypothetical protein